MRKPKSFNLSSGTRIGNYKVIKKIGRGYEGEVYKVSEVPTDSIRALKLIRTESMASIRQIAHTAWYFEQVKKSGHFSTYYHYGQWFLDDDEGCWYLVFEYIDGSLLGKLEPTQELFFKVVSALANVHECGYGVGDIESLTNVIVRDPDGHVVFIDCNTGCPDQPNLNIEDDCKWELPRLAERMFVEKIPIRVKKLLEAIQSFESFGPTTLRHLLNEI